MSEVFNDLLSASSDDLNVNYTYDIKSSRFFNKLLYDVEFSRDMWFYNLSGIPPLPDKDGRALRLLPDSTDNDRIINQLNYVPQSK